MRRKVLFCATVDYHFEAFHLPYLQWFRQQGWEVHVAASGSRELPYVDRKFELPVQRSPFRRENLQAYSMLKTIIEENGYDLIHGHTPMGGVLARLAARRERKKGTRVLYTAHGFHFCKGAPLLNWLVYFPIEKFLSSYTDCLITINEEDYAFARRRLHAGRLERVHGVGVDTERFRPLNEEKRIEARKPFGFRPEEFLLFYAAEFNGNKNQELLIRAMVALRKEAPQARLLLAGDGPMKEACQAAAIRLGVADRVDFLGHRKDIDVLLPLCDAAVASSRREGLPVNIMEAMACGLPVVASVNRGHSELVEDGLNGFLIPDENDQRFASRLLELIRSPELCRRMGEENTRRVQLYSLRQVKEELTGIYKRYSLEDKHEAEGKYSGAYL
ncbi:glycosyltransferase family 4 protein [Paenibacillus aurantius]|uniref:Glycosyltransferase family 4 protein n=1 Tax=Paenibacillus aurantius TaxID=2918900 RepID=A0AA96LF32_9BACL|nr:glycosyltransferase family 4 protein [Paenibacillus aurantius]WNQ12697.1 glycosyltransferase family 4 protein [Paenibacillus aurantius]